MSAWLRPAIPLVSAAFTVAVATLLAPIASEAWAPAALPAVVVSTWAAGWPGGVGALALVFLGRTLLTVPGPWTRPFSTGLWLILLLVSVAATEIVRKARAERNETRRLQQERAARAARAVADRRTAFLAHASDVLASSPDYQTTLTAVANLAVPQIADLCVVDIVNEAGEFTPLAVAHVDPRKVALVRELRRLYPLDPKAPFGAPRVLRTGQSQIYSEIADTAAADQPIQPSQLRVALALGIRSTLAVPLRVGGRRLGVISFATTDSGRKFVVSDVAFAEDLARRVAIAIDTAQP